MNQQYYYENLCKRCFVKINNPTKKEIGKIVMSEEKYECNCCHRIIEIVEYVEE